MAAFEAPLAIGADTGDRFDSQRGHRHGGVKPTCEAAHRWPGGRARVWTSLARAPVQSLDAALLHQVIAGHDHCDSTSIDQPVPDVTQQRSR